MKLRIYTKKDCHLCDEAKAIISKVVEGYPVEIQEIDIDQDPETYEKFRYEIPVIFLEEEKLFKYRVDAIRLKKAMEARL